MKERIIRTIAAPFISLLTLYETSEGESQIDTKPKTGKWPLAGIIIASLLR